MNEERKQPAEKEQSDAQEVGDELTDRVAEHLTATAEANAQGTGDESPVVEAAAEEVLEEEKVKDEIEIQIDLLQDPDWVVRREAVITLGEMGDERCVEPLLKALQDGDWQVREVAIDALAEVGSPAVEPLIRYLRHWDIRKYVIKTLGKIKDERVLDPLIAQLKNDEFGEDAVEALVELGSPAVGRLVESLKDKEETVRKRAVIALGRIKDSAALDSLVDMLHDKDWFTRLTAAAAIEKIGDERGRQAIKSLLKDPDLVVRMRVERILAAWKKQPAGTA
jgi:HEAT repeat protein